MTTVRAILPFLLLFLLAAIPLESTASLFTSIRNDDLAQVRKQLEFDSDVNQDVEFEFEQSVEYTDDASV